ncbi:MAG: TonB-dependent receptor [Pseudomonadota bacterium]
MIATLGLALTAAVGQLQAQDQASPSTDSAAAEVSERQELDAGNTPTLPLEVIQVTARRRAASVFDTAQPVTVVSDELLRASQPKVIADALRGQAGVFVQQTTPGQGNAIVRGLKGSEVLHLVDGVRLNNALFRNAPNQYLALIDPLQVSSTEVVRGSASTLYGADAMGGVVHFLTARPEFDSALQGGMDLIAGSVDDLLTVSGFASGGDDDSAWQVRLSSQDVGDRRTGSGVVAPSGYEARSGAVSWRQRISEASELQLDLQHLEQPSTPRVDELVPGFGETQPASSEFFFEPNRRSFAHLRLTGSSDGLLYSAYELHLSAQRITDDRRSRDFAEDVRTIEQNRSDLYGFSGQFERPLGVLTDLVYGFEFYDDRVSSARQLEALDTGERVPTIARFPDGSRLRNSALYVHLESAVSERFHLEAGVRYSRFAIDLAAADRPLGAELDLDEFTASMAARWALTDRVNLVANIGEGFRVPNIFDLGTLGPRPGNRFNVANPGLGPERVLSFDLGVKWRSPSWRGELVAFELDYEDQITSVFTGEVTPSGRQVVRSDNVGRVRLRGLELALAYQFNPEISGSLTLNSIRGVEDGAGGPDLPADRIPPFNGEASLSWQPAAPWKLSVLGRFARRQDRLSDRDRSDPRINPDGTPGWGVIDLRAGWLPADDWSVDLTLHNLADRSYREHGSGIDAPGRGAILALRKTFN